MLQHISVLHSAELAFASAQLLNKSFDVISCYLIGQHSPFWMKHLYILNMCMIKYQLIFFAITLYIHSTILRFIVSLIFFSNIWRKVGDFNKIKLNRIKKNYHSIFHSDSPPPPPLKKNLVCYTTLSKLYQSHLPKKLFNLTKEDTTVLQYSSVNFWSSIEYNKV